jgi:diguanylate cyclase (GGDEF)-like protein/putative nucleotidyltransferase with HDIG domain
MLALTSLGALGYVQLSSTSKTLSGAARDQGDNLTHQLAGALAGAGQAVANVIPFSDRGLDGVVLIDANGKVVAEAGSLAPHLVRLGPKALEAARAKRGFSEFRVPVGTVSKRIPRLTAWSPDSTFEVSVVPQPDGGAVLAGFHTNWATTKLRTAAKSTALSLGGGVLFIAFGLMLLLGRVVTAPVGRLATEVRDLGEGNLVATLSEQDSPELQQLASDISRMRDDLLEAVRESSTDPLTGIANHRAFHDRLDEAVKHSTSTGEPLAMIAIDLDRLKDINDRFGHVAGDRVISAVVARISSACTAEMLCARVGGDEFAVICPGMSRAAAEDAASRMRRSVAELPPESLLGSSDLAISVSVGVGDMPGGAATKDSLLHQADTELYRMKGRRDPIAAETQRPAAGTELTDVSRTVRALAVAVDAKDSGTSSHCATVAAYAVAIGRKLGMSSADLERLRRAALLHDVGKIGVPDAILGKPARLTAAEFDVMKGHSTLGYRILVNGGLGTDEALWVLHHHEHLDGSGYPTGLRGDEIPLPSRVLLVADAFEAMTSDRPYRSARPVEEAIAELRRCAGSQFDPTVVEAFVEVAPRAGSELPASVFERLIEEVPSP